MIGTVDAPGLIDTGIVIDASRSVPVAMTYVAWAIAAGTLLTTIITATELIQGC